MRRISWLIAALGLLAAATASAQGYSGERMLTLTAEQLWMVCAGAAFLGLRGFDRLNTSTFQRAVIARAILGAAVLLARQVQA